MIEPTEMHQGHMACKGEFSSSHWNISITRSACAWSLGKRGWLFIELDTGVNTPPSVDMMTTLPLAMFTYTQIPGGDAAAVRLMVISILVSLAALLASEVLARRTAARLGRG